MATRGYGDKSPQVEQSPGQYWHAQLEQAQKTFDKWEKKGDLVLRRYRDERDAVESGRKKFNILWSNIQVLSPAMYGRAAKPEVSRRYMDQDPVGRLASTMLQRAIEYEVEQFNDFDSAMKGAVEDRLLPGRGIAWIRYSPNIVVDDTADESVVDNGNQLSNTVAEAPTTTAAERVDSAHSPCDYVYWKDFLHSPSRTWEEVWWVCRWVYMTKDEGVERFGNVFNNVPIDSEQPIKEWKETASKNASLDKKAKVAEIWCKRTGMVHWVAKGYPQQLDEKSDPLQLEGFFPCPKPLFATTTTGSLIPIPDYLEYQDQASELDMLSNRLYNLTRACKAVGVFNGEYKELQRLLNEGVDNKLFPVTNWAALSEKGGLRGAVEMLDLETVIKAITVLSARFEAVKQGVYEIYGLGDIIRGASNPNETLGAQQLKANFGNLRLRSSQGDIARFASDLFRMKAQLICTFYPPEIIIEMSGVMNTQDGQDPELLGAALRMLKDSSVRDFRISVESDTLAQIDEEQEKKNATEIVAAIGSFFKESLPVVEKAPEILPLVTETLGYIIRRFRGGRTLEASVEKSMKALEAGIQQKMQNPQPNPEMERVKADQAAAEARIQADQQNAQIKMHLAQQEAQMEDMLEKQRMAYELQMEQAKIAAEQNFARFEALIKAKTQIEIAEINAGATLQASQISAAQQGAQ